MRPQVVITFAVIFASASTTGPELERGRYQATLTTTSARHLAGRATYTRCGHLFHIWLADTVSPDVAMEFGTRVPTLRLASFRAEPMTLAGLLPPTQPGLGPWGYFRLYVPRDTLFFADSGALRLTRLGHGAIEGEFSYAVSEAWKGIRRKGASLVGTFRASRDSVGERTTYRGARCDHPGAEWPLVDQDE